MKKYIYVFIALLGLSLTACNQSVLDIPQKSVDDMETYIANATEVETLKLTASMYYGLRNVYNVPWFLIVNEITGENWAGGSDSTDQPPHIKIGNLAISADNSAISGTWQALYNMIYRCNIVTDGFAEATEAYKVRAVAEGKALRAWAYMQLVMMFGTPPLVDHVLLPEEYTSGNTDRATAWSAIEKDFTEAAAVLPSKSGKNGQKAIGGRMTKEACIGFLAKAQLYQGKYSEAAANLKKVIDSNLYELAPSFDYILRMKGDFCNEYLFEMDQDASDTTTAGQAIRTNYHRYNGLRPELIKHPDELWASSWGFVNVTDGFAEEMIAHDGASPRRIATVMTFDEFATDGLYFHYTKNTPGINLNWFSSAGYARVKGLIYTADKVPGTSSTHASSLANIPILRYADILLMYAECAANGAGDKALGLQYLNLVRARAGIDPAPSLSMDDAMYGIKAERRYEFYFEEAIRWFDMMRWGDFVSERQRLLTKYDIGHTIPSMTKESTIGNWKFTRETFSDGEKPDKHHALLPFPETEVTASEGNLVQNEGY